MTVLIGLLYYWLIGFLIYAFLVFGEESRTGRNPFSWGAMFINLWVWPVLIILTIMFYYKKYFKKKRKF